MTKQKILLGYVGVDSGQIVITDPAYLGMFTNNDYPKESGHPIYKHEDGSYWQYGEKTAWKKEVNLFPGTYAEVIPKYGKSANDLIREGAFTATDIDPWPHVGDGEMSYAGACKLTRPPSRGGQLTNGIAETGVVCQSGARDGCYPVYAEIGDVPGMGERVVRVTIEFLTEFLT